jgi:hypothetical protein
MDLQVAVFLLVCGASVACIQSTCSRRRVVHIIEYGRCRPKRLLSSACLGSCKSYTRVSPTTPERIERSCMCCQAIRRHKRRVVLNCPDWKRRFMLRRIQLYISIPVRCMCRPCTVIPEALVAAESNYISNVIKREDVFNWQTRSASNMIYNKYANGPATLTETFNFTDGTL